MRNFILILRKYNFFILFLLLQIFAFYLIFLNNSYQRATIVTTSNNLVGQVYEGYSVVNDYLRLGSTNKLLAAENARLRNFDSTSFYSLRTHQKQVFDSIYKQQYTYIDARVINNSIAFANNYLTLDKGSIHGVKPEQAVISSTGIVGIVKNVSSHYSTVISLLHSSLKISSRIKSNGYFGSCVWSGRSPQIAYLKDIPSHAIISLNDTIETSSYSSIFPQGIAIGRIVKLGNSGESFKNIELEYATNFENLSYVYVINNILKEELDSLESKNTLNDR